MCQEGNKGNWTALYVFGGLKGATGFVLMIVGIILMAHSPKDCNEIEQCYQEKGLTKCSPDRRLSEAGQTQTQPLESEYSRSVLPLAKKVLGANLLDLMAAPKDYSPLPPSPSSPARALKEDCYIDIIDEEECNESMQKMSDGAGSWGTCLLVVGLIGSVSGGLSGLAAKQKRKVWMGISMGIDIVMSILCVAMSFLCGVLAAVMDAICQWFKDEAAKDLHADCWEDLNNDVCSWADLFGTAVIMFLVMFFVEISTTIVDCSAMCCCPAKDAPWSKEFVREQVIQEAAAKPGTVIGQPVGVQPSKAVADP